MPLRQSLLKKCWHMSEFPVPRFLAPRVFEPWPRARRALHAKALLQEPAPTSPAQRFGRRTLASKSIDYAPQADKSREKRYKSCNLQRHRRNSPKEKHGKIHRWRELVFWLNKYSSYRINMDRMHTSSSLDWQAFRPRISEEEVNNILTDVAKDSLDWESRDKDRRNRLWLELMAKVLCSHPDKALDFLEATIGRGKGCPGLPPVTVSDTIHCIILHYFQNVEVCMSEKHVLIATRIVRLQLQMPFSFMAPLSNHATYLLLSHLPKEYLREFYLYICAKDQSDLSIWSLMQFASKLARFGETDLAFEAVKKLTKSNCLLNRRNTLSIITCLLHESHLNKEAVNNIEDIFQYLVLCGMNPNIYTYNVLLHYTTKIPNPEATWEIYNDMIKAGIQPDAFTYSILLNDAKQRLDTTDMRRIIGFIQERGIMSEYLVTDMLHAIYLLRGDEGSILPKPGEEYKGPEPAFDQMLRLYSRYFKMEPLTRVIPGLSNIFSPLSNPSSKHSLWDPPGATMCVMITGFLSIVNSEGAKEFYEHFRNLVRTGDPSITYLMGRTYIYNVILMCFYRFEERAKDAPDVIADMLLADREPSNPVLDPTTNDPSTTDTSLLENSDSKVERRKPHKPLLPDIYTWSILVKIFVRLKLFRAAEKVLNMMTRRNIKPTKVTWTSLISGYARMQNPCMTADAVVRLEKAGYSVDDHIFRVLARVHQQDKLMRAIESSKTQPLEPVHSEWLDNLKKELSTDMLQKELEEKDDYC